LNQIQKRIKTLTRNLTDGEVSSKAFEKARDDLDSEKKELEEKCGNSETCYSRMNMKNHSRKYY